MAFNGEPTKEEDDEDNNDDEEEEKGDTVPAADSGCFFFRFLLVPAFFFFWSLARFFFDFRFLLSWNVHNFYFSKMSISPKWFFCGTEVKNNRLLGGGMDLSTSSQIKS